ncbi:MAG: hypothetical protein JNM93_12880 [Bacteriovoracaceae bacterium]|nr:hypothetical protein [Bacteriovoracaceae bacterium]
MKILTILLLLVCYQTKACDKHINPKLPVVVIMSEDMASFWSTQSAEAQLETTKLIERLWDHYLNRSKLSVEVNLSVFTGLMMHKLDGSFQSWPKGKDFNWVKIFFDDLINHPDTYEEVKQRLISLRQKF